MELAGAELLGQVKRVLMPQFIGEKVRLDWIDRWLRWDHDRPHSPRASTKEYQELSTRAQDPWLALVVTSVAQQLYVEGYRAAEAEENTPAWRMWQANGLDRRQSAVHRAALGYGYSYVTVVPGKMPGTNEPMPTIRGVSPRRMLAFYEDPAEDDWPLVAMQCTPLGPAVAPTGWKIRVYDEKTVHHLVAKSFDGSGLEVVRAEEHGVGFCPVVRFTNLVDLEGRMPGEVEPYISTAARIDQTTFDRLVVQRFASWVVRTIAGMAKPDAGTDAAAEKLRLKVEDLLVAEDPDTKFGTLSATPLDGFIKAKENDIQVLSAVSQTPAHELLGTIANMAAEALAAARASSTAKADERKHSFGESWEQVLRVGSQILGDAAGAADFSSQVRWKDTEIRSLAQAADALGKLATMGVPLELLLEKIPAFTQQDVERAKALIAEGGSMDQLVRQLTEGAETPAATLADEIKAKADAMAVLVKAGVTPESAARLVGLEGATFTDEPVPAA